MEKAREIKVKADEEFAIEKAKIVRQETQNLDQQAERKRKQAEIQKRMCVAHETRDADARSAKSTATNKSRLRVLEAREQMLEDILEAARKQVSEVSKDENKYADLLKKLVLQALFTIMEHEVVVQGRKKDSSALGKAIESASSEFKEKTGNEIKITQKDELSDDLAGGVIVTGHSSKLTVDNTLDQRLHIMEECVLSLDRAHAPQAGAALHSRAGAPQRLFRPPG